MSKKKQITNYTINTDNIQYTSYVSISEHAIRRYSERNITDDMFVLASNIMALGTKILKMDNQEVCIIDKISGFTIIVGISIHGIRVNCHIITVLNTSTNVFVKSNTMVVNIDELF